MKWRIVGVLGILLAASSLLAAEPQQQAQKLLADSGVRGGLIVQVGCDDGQLTAALQANKSFVVQSLDTDTRKIDAARKQIQSRGLYGSVSVSLWDGKRLPYIENFVNLIIVSDEYKDKVPESELLRVLAPKGIALVGGKKIVKPQPKDTDEWTHYLHDPSNNAVAHDNEIGFLTRMQWINEPRYSRHHDHMSVADAMVSANGRVF